MVRFLSASPLVAIDTEFHRERSYFAKLALVQIAAGDQVFLIDPLRVDISCLRDVFESDAEIIFHAASQDLEILRRKTGVLPNKIFDTQIAAGFLGYSSPSLLSLLEAFLGVAMDKSDRLSDWLSRPLEDKQLHYAAQDVIYLVELRDVLLAEIAKLGRTSWLSQELDDYISQDFSATTDPNRAWLKIREVRGLKGKTKQVAMALAAWREVRAIEIDVPARFVLADLAVATIAQNAPKKTADLRGIRGVDTRNMAGGVDQEIIAVVAKATATELTYDDDRQAPEQVELPAGAAALLVAWLTSRAKQLKIDSNLLGSRSDITDLYSPIAESKLARGWRKEAVGNYIERIVSGEIALALTKIGEVTMVTNGGDEVA